MRGFFITQKNSQLFRRLTSVVAFVLTVSLVLSPVASYAQAINFLNLPVPGTMIAPSPAFAPVLLKGMTIHPEDPLKFDFIIDSGNTDFTVDEVKAESEKLVKYFLASMTVPKDDLWVNLSPYEDERIIPQELGKTGLGRDMLAQDYLLKQLTASLMYPEDELGKKFWDRVYKRAEEEFGTSEIPVNTFNKVWILPEKATVYEYEQTVYVVNSWLKVMLDGDYEAMQHGNAEVPVKDNNLEVSESIIREIIIPEIEREVNQGQHFAPLRQIYHSLILAKWYKETVKNSLLSQVYADRNMIDGIESEEKDVKDQIYAQYMEAYKKGVFNYIKEDYDRLSNEVIPRKYFSGGFRDKDITFKKSHRGIRGRGLLGKGFTVAVMLTAAAMLSQPDSVYANLENYTEANKVERVDSQSEVNAESSQETKNQKELDKKLNYDFAQQEDLQGAVIDGDIDKVRLMLRSGVDVDGVDMFGFTGLMYAVQEGKSEIFKLLVKHKADVNIKNGRGKTALHISAIQGYVEMFEILIKKGADVNAKNDYGITVLMDAAYKGRASFVESLLEKGVDPNAQDRKGASALHWAAERGHASVIAPLVNKGADINIKDIAGEAPLKFASQSGHSEFVETLLIYGAEVNIRDYEGASALFMPAGRGHGKIVEILLDYGIDVNIEVADGWTSLMAAAGYGHTEIVKALIKKGADVNAVQDNGMTALDYAKRHGYEDVVRILLEAGARKAQAARRLG